MDRARRKKNAFDVRSGDVMIFNKNSSSLLPRKKQQNKYNRKKTLKNSEERKKGKKGKTKAKRIERNSRGLKEIAQTVILLVWRLGDRLERKERKPEKK